MVSPPLCSHARASATHWSQVTSSWPSIIRQTRTDDRMPVVPYEISTDRSRRDLPRGHRFRSPARYRSPGVEFAVVERSVEGSLPFGVYADDGSQVGFARVVTDRATFAWIADVYNEAEHRGHGLGKRLVAE